MGAARRSPLVRWGLVRCERLVRKRNLADVVYETSSVSEVAHFGSCTELVGNLTS